MPTKKLRIGVLFGGQSAEHEVSLASATSVIANLDKKKYQVVPIGISRAGEWYCGKHVLPLMKAGKKIPRFYRFTLKPEPGAAVDVIFPVLHGTRGEDGTVQGLLELASIPYVGAGVLGSAVGMDKVAQKLIFEASSLPTPRFLYFTTSEYRAAPRAFQARIKTILGLPCFIKPANLGSSVGISKAHNPVELTAAIALASRYDQRIIVEQNIERALEIEVAVLGNEKPQASQPGQVVSSNEFYDYNAKYVDGKSQAIIPAPLPKVLAKIIRELSLHAFRALDLSGMARVDFLVSRNLKHVYLNEVNTIPGFTSISMYPKLWQASGLPYPKLLDKLISLALERAHQKAKRATSYQPKTKWYR